MAARAGFQALVLSAALVMASGAMSDDARAQADEAAVESGEAAAVQQGAVEQPLPQQKPAAADRPAKSDLDQSAVRAAPVTRSPRLTRTSTRAVALPKILGSYR